MKKKFIIGLFSLLFGFGFGFTWSIPRVYLSSVESTGLVSNILTHRNAHYISSVGSNGSLNSSSISIFNGSSGYTFSIGTRGQYDIDLSTLSLQLFQFGSYFSYLGNSEYYVLPVFSQNGQYSINGGRIRSTGGPALLLSYGGDITTSPVLVSSYSQLDTGSFCYSYNNNVYNYCRIFYNFDWLNNIPGYTGTTFDYMYCFNNTNNFYWNYKDGNYKRNIIDGGSNGFKGSHFISWGNGYSSAFTSDGVAGNSKTWYLVPWGGFNFQTVFNLSLKGSYASSLKYGFLTIRPNSIAGRSTDNTQTIVISKDSTNYSRLLYMVLDCATNSYDLLSQCSIVRKGYFRVNTNSALQFKYYGNADDEYGTTGSDYFDTDKILHYYLSQGPEFSVKNYSGYMDSTGNTIDFVQFMLGNSNGSYYGWNTFSDNTLCLYSYSDYDDSNHSCGSIVGGCLDLVSDSTVDIPLDIWGEPDWGSDGGGNGGNGSVGGNTYISGGTLTIDISNYGSGYYYFDELGSSYSGITYTNNSYENISSRSFSGFWQNLLINGFYFSQCPYTGDFLSLRLSRLFPRVGQHLDSTFLSNFDFFSWLNCPLYSLNAGFRSTNDHFGLTSFGQILEYSGFYSNNMNLSDFARNKYEIYAFFDGFLIIILVVLFFSVFSLVHKIR